MHVLIYEDQTINNAQNKIDLKHVIMATSILNVSICICFLNVSHTASTRKYSNRNFLHRNVKKTGKKCRRFQVSHEHFLHSNSQKSCKQNWHFQNEWTEKQIYISGCSILLRRWQFIQSLNVKPKCIMTLFIMDWKLALFVWVVGFLVVVVYI